eukprot:TRINITY_DN3524_c0_g1_i1.p2 TRINITY_DN3524_c0_g1~~TRINITY_DN3524_c0_g1_i1.p2  ORF type:complete len:187 (-),score=51.02 TRINITY_DN3524_c0_g1_i1:49-609(-)
MMFAGGKRGNRGRLGGQESLPPEELIVSREQPYTWIDTIRMKDVPKQYDTIRGADESSQSSMETTIIHNRTGTIASIPSAYENDGEPTPTPNPDQSDPIAEDAEGSPLLLTPTQNQETIDAEVQQWLRYVLVELLRVVWQLEEGEEKVWKGAVSCMLMLMGTEGGLGVTTAKQIPIEVVGEMVNKC